MDEFMDTAELAATLKRSVGTIRNWRSRGIGPDYYTTGDTGNVLYKAEDVELWMSKHKKENLK